ncbi:tyrosine-type recombinase/integrase [Candidatus Jidaibacter acanthamoebae]|uniref:tyrosine-type recombinase/integrase n=1 Tax=Candidatus Jidaibacter acanthamoebae TaxID=86105 RepID=UPI0006A70F60|nr:tyrosine-type recombinase/integrase [Candidatus Jidaibacter acanthamoeba]
MEKSNLYPLPHDSPPAFEWSPTRPNELVKIKIDDIDFDQCQINIIVSKGKKDRKVPFPNSFKEILAMQVNNIAGKNGKYLFESSWKKPYTDRAIRKILEKYTKLAGMERSISPHKLRHFLLAWLKRQGIDDALIQPYSGHETRQALEIYRKSSIREAQKEYDNAIGKFPT